MRDNYIEKIVAVIYFTQDWFQWRVLCQLLLVVSTFGTPALVEIFW
jgi:hypothetical protein